MPSAMRTLVDAKLPAEALRKKTTATVESKPRYAIYDTHIGGRETDRAVAAQKNPTFAGGIWITEMLCG